MNSGHGGSRLSFWTIRIKPEFVGAVNFTKETEIAPGASIARGLNIFEAIEGDCLAVSPTCRIASRKEAQLESKDLAEAFLSFTAEVFERRYRITNAREFLEIVDGWYNLASPSSCKRIRSDSETARLTMSKRTSSRNGRSAP